MYTAKLSWHTAGVWLKEPDFITQKAALEICAAIKWIHWRDPVKNKDWGKSGPNHNGSHIDEWVQIFSEFKVEDEDAS